MIFETIVAASLAHDIGNPLGHSGEKAIGGFHWKRKKYQDKLSKKNGRI
jgi:dGTP triphosphohydrolase